MVTLVILAALLAMGVGYLSAWKETSKIQAAAELIEGDTEFAAQQARVFGLVPTGTNGPGVAPPQPDTELFVRVVKKELGQPVQILKEHPLGSGLQYLVAGDVVQVDAAAGNFQGVALQIGPKFALNTGTCILFSGTGQPVTVAGGSAVAVNPPTITFGSKRRAVEVKVSSTGAVTMKTVPNPF